MSLSALYGGADGPDLTWRRPREKVAIDSLDPPDMALTGFGIYWCLFWITARSYLSATVALARAREYKQPSCCLFCDAIAVFLDRTPFVFDVYTVMQSSCRAETDGCNRLRASLMVLVLRVGANRQCVCLRNLLRFSKNNAKVQKFHGSETVSSFRLGVWIQIWSVGQLLVGWVGIRSGQKKTGQRWPEPSRWWFTETALEWLNIKHHQTTIKILGTVSL